MKHRTKLVIVHGICWLVFLSSLFTGFPGMDDYNPEYIGWVEKGPKQKINRARSQPLLKLSSLPYLIILSQVQWPLIFSHLYLYLLCLITPFGNSQWNMNRLQMIYEDLPTNKCWFSAMSKKLEGISHYAMIFPLATAHLLNSHQPERETRAGPEPWLELGRVLIQSADWVCLKIRYPKIWGRIIFPMKWPSGGCTWIYSHLQTRPIKLWLVHH
jgi:hypothetical protein